MSSKHVIALVALSAIVVMPACDRSAEEIAKTRKEVAETRDRQDELERELENLRDEIARVGAQVELIGDSVSESLAKKAQAPPLPKPLAVVEQGGEYWGVYWVGEVATLDAVVAQLEEAGFVPSSGDISCDEGASDSLGVAADATRVAVYFSDELDAGRFAVGTKVKPKPIGLASVATFCLD